MDPKKAAKQTFDFYRATFESTFNAMSMLQEQSRKIYDMYLNQMEGIPEEGKKAVREWMEAYKEGGKKFKSTIDESFQKMEEFFTEAVKPAKKENRSSKEV